jgi:hypothetical protein
MVSKRGKQEYRPYPIHWQITGGFFASGQIESASEEASMSQRMCIKIIVIGK